MVRNRARTGNAQLFYGGMQPYLSVLEWLYGNPRNQIRFALALLFYALVARYWQTRRIVSRWLSFMVRNSNPYRSPCR